MQPDPMNFKQLEALCSFINDTIYEIADHHEVFYNALRLKNLFDQEAVKSCPKLYALKRHDGPCLVLTRLESSALPVTIEDQKNYKPPMEIRFTTRNIGFTYELDVSEEGWENKLADMIGGSIFYRTRAYKNQDGYHPVDLLKEKLRLFKFGHAKGPRQAVEPRP